MRRKLPSGINPQHEIADRIETHNAHRVGAYCLRRSRQHCRIERDAPYCAKRFPHLLLQTHETAF